MSNYLLEKRVPEVAKVKLSDKLLTPHYNKPKVDGGPSPYYDFPFKEWETTNDMMEYLAANKWGPEAIHLKDIFKGLCRWGQKNGTDTLYDTRKIIYYGARVMRMLVGEQKTREYLQELLDDKQFGGNK